MHLTRPDFEGHIRERGDSIEVLADATIDNVGVAADVGTVPVLAVTAFMVKGKTRCRARPEAVRRTTPEDLLPNELCLLCRRQLRGEVDIARQIGATLHLVGLPRYGVFEQQATGSASRPASFRRWPARRPTGSQAARGRSAWRP